MMTINLRWIIIGSLSISAISFLCGYTLGVEHTVDTLYLVGVAEALNAVEHICKTTHQMGIYWCAEVTKL